MQDELKWYAVYTKPRAEKKVFQMLSLKGIEAYLPLQTTIKQWSDRKKKVEEPLFKSYLFVQTNFEKSHLDILSINGAVKFVRSGKELTSIRPEIIDAIKLSLLHYNEITTSGESFSKNQQVTVIAGPLKGFEGIIAEQHGNRYFAIHIPQLGTHMLIKIPAAYLKAM